MKKSICFLLFIFTCNKPVPDFLPDPPAEVVRVACYNYMTGSGRLDSMQFAGHTYILPVNDSVTLPAHVTAAANIFATVFKTDSLTVLNGLFYVVNVGAWSHYWHTTPADALRGWSAPSKTIVWTNRVINTDSVYRIELSGVNPFYIPPYVPLPQP